MEQKKWKVCIDRKDLGLKVVDVEVETVVEESNAFKYGNGKCGALIFHKGDEIGYDLRYCREKDLHKAMLVSYFGCRLIDVKEV